MKAFDQLLSTALLGSGREDAPLPAVDPRVSEVLAAVSNESAESRLLSTAAVLSLYGKAGARPAKGIDPPPRSNRDDAPPCSPRAGEILEQLLRDGPRELIPEWLALADRAKRRPPAKLLPRLLDAAVERKELRDLAESVAGNRGVWLMSLNPRWQFAALSENHDETWQTGNRDQRVAALRSIRATDPIRARELLAATWKEDSADDRVRFLSCFQARLSIDDEAFLESCLDDRSKNVREKAADLLARLPQSSFATRMAQRVGDCLRFTPAEAGAILKLKRGKPAVIDVKLPETCDRAMQRDGITEKAPAGVGLKQWWLGQMLSLVAPTFWSTLWSVAPAEIVSAKSDFKEMLRQAWTEATKRNPDSQWAEALLRESVGAQHLSIDLGLLTCVEEGKRDEILGLALKSVRDSDSPGFMDVLAETGAPLSHRVSTIIVDKLGRDHWLGQGRLVGLLHVAALPNLETKLTPLSGQPYTGRAADEMLRFIALRRDMHGSFTS